MIRPQPARWFEAVCARDDAFVALEALAASGCAEIEWHAGGQAPESAEANRRLKEYAALARGYRAYWPRPELRAAAARKAPAAAFEAALATLTAWAAEAAPVVAALQEREGALAELAIIARLLDALETSAIDLAQLAQAHAGVQARVLVYPEGADPAIPAEVLVRRLPVGRELYALVVGVPAALEPLEREAAGLHGRAIALPAWLERDAAGSRARLQTRRAAAVRDAAALRATLDASLERHAVALALGDVARATWCFANVGAIEGREALARITGWTDDAPRLTAALEASGARAFAAFPPAPAGASAPLLLRNPWWARPFEIFSRLFGMPAREGADPSMVLAVVSPLLFGYMFGDVGQGLVLVAAGLALRRKYPAFRLLIPGGIAAVAFGIAFGSVFGREDWIAPLWLSPLAAPLAVLVVPLWAGAALLTLGLALGALEAYWRHAFGEWLLRDAGFVIVYLGLVLVPLHAAAGAALAAGGALAFVAGRAAQERRLGAALPALGALLERTLQILVNTLSFARVGAFALAHAGLAAAVVALAEATGNRVGFWLALALGNALVIVLEGVVVGIQTTRLILFEFFVRFFGSHGREFHPLLPPIATEEHP